MDDAQNDERIAFAYQEGKATTECHLASIETLRAESSTTLTLIVTGAGAAFGYGITLLETNAHPALMRAAFFTVGHLFACGALLLLKCLLTREVWPSTNEPAHLNPEGATAAKVRELDIINLQHRCTKNRTTAETMGKWLNRVRILVLAAPLTFWAAWAAAPQAAAPAQQQVQPAAQVTPNARGASGSSVGRQ